TAAASILTRDTLNSSRICPITGPDRWPRCTPERTGWQYSRPACWQVSAPNHRWRDVCPIRLCHAGYKYLDEITYLSRIIQQTTMSIDKNEFRKYAIKHHRIGSQHVDGFIGRVE